MKNVFAIALLCGLLVGWSCRTDGDHAEKVNKIIAAKAVVRSKVNYPDTLSFHDMSTNVSGNTVTLKFTAKNAFGVPETHTMNIEVN